MTDTFTASPVSFGEFAFMADNYGWSRNKADAAARFKRLIAQNQFPLHSDTLSIAVCRTGSFSVKSGEETLTVGPKAAIITLGGQQIKAVSISPDCRLFFFAGKSRHFNTQIDLDDANRILRHALELKRPFLFQLTPREFRAMEKMYFSAKEILQMAPERTKTGVISGYARILSALIAARLQQDEQQEPGSVSPANKTLLASFLDNVSQHCRKERGIAFYSSLSNLTPKYFSKQIRKLSGQAPGAIIEEYTIAEAKSLLSSKKYSVKEISNLLNFSSPSSFCKYFKAAVGIPPGHFMRQG